MSAFTPNPVYEDPDNVNTNLLGIEHGELYKLFGKINESIDSSNATYVLANKFLSTPSSQVLRELAHASIKKGGWLSKEESNSILFPQPATPEEIEDVKKLRPGLDNIPAGVSVNTLNAMASRYDDHKYWSYIAEQPSSTLTSLSGYVGELALDPVSLLAGEGAGKLAAKSITPFANRALETLGTKTFAGSGAAQFATNLAKQSLPVGAGFAGFSTVEQTAENINMADRGQTPDYMQSVLNIGQSIGVGTLFGAVGYGLLGFLGSNHWSHIRDTTKQQIGRYYRPWSEDAAQDARVDATAQMVDGKLPNVADIHKQGSIDEAIKFRQVMRESGVDLPKLSEDLETTKKGIAIELNTLNKGNVFEGPINAYADEALEILKKDPAVIHDEKLVIEGFKKSLNLTDRESKNLYDAISEFIPAKPLTDGAKRVSQEQIYKDLKSKGESAVQPSENVNKLLRMEREIKELKEIASNPEENDIARRKAENRIRNLNKRLPDLKSLNDELNDIENKIFKDNKLIKNFRRTDEYKRLAELAKGDNSARNMYIRTQLEHKPTLKTLSRNILNARARDLYDQWHLADSIQKHVNGTHESVSMADRKAYFDHLKSSGLEDIDFNLPDADTKIEDVLSKFDEQYVKSLTDIINKPEIADDFNRVKADLGKQNTFKVLARKLADCIYGE